MNSYQLLPLAGLTLFVMGFHGVCHRRHLIQQVVALNICGSGAFLVLIGLATRSPSMRPDPIPHAMVLTGVVVSISATALALAMVRRYYRESGRTYLPGREDAGP